MHLLPQKLRRRLNKTYLKHGLLGTVARCFAWPAMYLGWRIAAIKPSNKDRQRAGEQFDEEFGVDTCRERSGGWTEEIDSPNWADGEGYDPAPTNAVRAALGSLPIDHKQYVFVDLGSGKGRVLLVAAEFPFAEVVGVEYAPDLHEIARRNIAVYPRAQWRCGTVRAECGDAAEFDYPLTPLVLFFHHPFGEPVFRKVMAAIDRSLAEAPRKIFVVYHDPICGWIFEEGGFCRLGDREEACAVFESV